MSQHTPDPAFANNTPPTPGSGKGMPDKTPADGRARPGSPDTPADASDEASLALPHERDQSVDMTHKGADPQIKQADADLKHGLKDTGKSPVTDATYDKLKRP